MLDCWRCVVLPRTTGGNTPRGSTGPRPSPRPNDGDWPTRYTSMAPPPRSDASGYPNVVLGRKSAHWVFRPKRTGHGKRSYAKPWNPNGKPNCHRTSMNLSHYQSMDPNVNRGESQECLETCGDA